jgi:hypothetical protein
LAESFQLRFPKKQKNEKKKISGVLLSLPLSIRQRAGAQEGPKRGRETLSRSLALREGVQEGPRRGPRRPKKAQEGPRRPKRAKEGRRGPKKKKMKKTKKKTKKKKTKTKKKKKTKKKETTFFLRPDAAPGKKNKTGHGVRTS